MPDLISCVPISSPIVADPTVSDPPGKHQFQQLLSQFMSNAIFLKTESEAAPKLATVAEDCKMNKLQEELEILKLQGAGIAHDLGNVLTVILGNLELAKLSQPKSELWQTLHQLEEAVNMAKGLHIELHQLFQQTKLIILLDELLEEATRLGLSGSESRNSSNHQIGLGPVEWRW